VSRHYCLTPSAFQSQIKRPGEHIGSRTGVSRQPSVGIDKELNMLHYAVVFLVIALIAAVFGFGGIAAGAVGIAKILFFVFVIMAVVTFVLSLLKRG
jgi:uncharacterized membrane protein YtjA (UPF0391 family)